MGFNRWSKPHTPPVLTTELCPCFFCCSNSSIMKQSRLCIMPGCVHDPIDHRTYSIHCSAWFTLSISLTFLAFRCRLQQIFQRVILDSLRYSTGTLLSFLENTYNASLQMDNSTYEHIVLASEYPNFHLEIRVSILKFFKQIFFLLLFLQQQPISH